MTEKSKTILFLVICSLLLLISSQITSAQDNNEYPTDTDGDGIPDEVDPDDDGDGFYDTDELEAGTDPLDLNSHPVPPPLDTDGDFIPDSADPDDDNDGLSDDNEKILKTNPRWMDTDDDRITDYEETVLGTDPLNKDTDDDGFVEGDELFAGTDPMDNNSYPKGVIANAGEDQIVYPNEGIMLDSLYSIGNKLSFSWDFDTSDGIVSDSIMNKIRVSYPEEGIYTVTLTVNDGEISDSDTCLIIVVQRLAASITIERNQKTNTSIYQEGIDLDLKMRDNNSVVVEITGELQEGVLVAFTVDSYTLTLFENEELQVRFDDQPVSQVEMTELVDYTGEIPFCNLSITFNKLRVIFYIPGFSTHTITVEKIRKDTGEENIEKPEEDNFYWYLLGAALILVLVMGICFVLANSIKNSQKMNYYHKLTIDDESNIELMMSIKNRNWEDYDSDK